MDFFGLAATVVDLVFLGLLFGFELFFVVLLVSFLVLVFFSAETAAFLPVFPFFCVLGMENLPFDL